MRLFLFTFSTLLFCEAHADYYPDSDPIRSLLQADPELHLEQMPVQITHWSNMKNLSTPLLIVRRKRSHRAPHSGDSKYMKYLKIGAACVIIGCVAQICYSIFQNCCKEGDKFDLNKPDYENMTQCDICLYIMYKKLGAWLPGPLGRAATISPQPIPTRNALPVLRKGSFPDRESKDGQADQDSKIRTDSFASSCAKWKYIMERQHSFTREGTWSRDCDSCGISVWIASYDCSYCYQYVHEKCTNMLAVPCVPKNEKTLKQIDKRLISERDGYDNEDDRLDMQKDLPTDNWRYLKIPDLTHKNAHPQIPQQLIHCVRALDVHFMHREKLYFDPNEHWKEGYNFIKYLALERKVVIRDSEEPYRITSAIKVILAHMTEALIRFGDKYAEDGGKNYFSNQDPFLKALKAKKDQQESAIKAAFNKIRAPCEKLTLAFMMIHWKRVLAHSDKNKITVDELAPAIAHFVIRHVDCVEVTKMLLLAKMEMWEGFLDFYTTVEESMNMPKDISKV